MKVISVFGTRPEAIKMAPVVEELKKDSAIDSKVIVTAQHREMLDQVLDLFSIQPDYDLNIMKDKQTLTGITTRILEGIQPILADERPDLVLVHGDTSTTFGTALASFYEKIPVGHVEAGLRTYNKYSPYPEEMNRRLTGALTDLHFAPTKTAEENLLKEGYKKESIYVTGNTVIDALLQTVEKPYNLKEIPEMKDIDFNKKIILLTAHRRENLGENMVEIFSAVKGILEKVPGTEVVFPIHKNPAVRKIAYSILGETSGVHFIEPLDYQPFVNLQKAATIILTDSGGIQEEAPSLGKPVLVLRDTTERPEAVAAGTVLLAGVTRDSIMDKSVKLLTDEGFYNQMAQAENPYGDGKAAKRIVEYIKKWGNGMK